MLDHLNKKGFVYLITHSDHSRVKIGFAKNVSRRLANLQNATFLDLVIFDAYPGTMFDERILHKRFWKDRVRGEWFKFSAEIFDFAEEAEGYRRRVFVQVIFNPHKHKTVAAIAEAIEAVPISEFVRDFASRGSGGISDG